MPPSTDCHKEKQNKNYEIYEFIKSSTKNYKDWESVILFYSSLHCVDYFFATPPITRHPTGHPQRNKLVSRHLKKYAQNYLYSYHISKWARYEDIEITDTMRDICLRNYNSVKQLVPT